MKYGYARVSTKEQNLGRQIKQLKEAGIQEENIFEEKISGATTEREKLQELLEVIEVGDEIIVVDLTRISRSTQDLFKLVADIKEKGAALKSLKDTWLDTSSDNPYSEFLLTIMAGVNQLERDLIKMRQREGIEIAKENGKYEGRPKKYTDKHAGMKMALQLYEAGEHTIKEIEEITNVGKSSLYREIAKRKNESA
ncbi:recombinase family protein [Thalassobacillus sp. B23F22_16]|uniref:recombinase family protein n=1 Tax=Thalassobacillus sp. B23F22_16 TaxID=3459513 RepID=UPI00373E6E18